MTLEEEIAHLCMTSIHLDRTVEQKLKALATVEPWVMLHEDYEWLYPRIDPIIKKRMGEALTSPILLIRTRAEQLATPTISTV